MLYRELGRTGWKASVVGLGTWNLGNQWGELDDATAWSIVRTAFDSGVNLFDTAESYGIPNGCSEERLGTALSGIRHRCLLVSKIGHWGARTGQSVPKTTPDMIRLCAHACLHRLRTDWVDVMLCHEGDIEDPSIFIEAFDMLRKAGRVREYGISTDRLDVIEKFDDVSGGKCSVVEINHSLLNRVAEAELLPFCQERNIAVLIRGPLAMGLLGGKYDARTRFTDTVRSHWHQSDEAQAHRDACGSRPRPAAPPGEPSPTTTGASTAAIPHERSGTPQGTATRDRCVRTDALPHGSRTSASGTRFRCAGQHRRATGADRPRSAPGRRRQGSRGSRRCGGGTGAPRRAALGANDVGASQGPRGQRRLGALQRRGRFGTHRPARPQGRRAPDEARR